MKNTTKAGFAQLAFVLICLSFLTLALLGQVPSCQAGWVAYPPRVPVLAMIPPDRKRRRPPVLALTARLRASGQYLARSWPPALLRSLLVALLWAGSGCPGSPWLLVLPLGLWLGQAGLVGWPHLRQSLAGRVLGWLLTHSLPALLGALSGWGLRRWLFPMPGTPVLEAPTLSAAVPLLGGCVYCNRDAPYVDVQPGAAGGYEATLDGHFTLRVAGDDPFRARCLLLFLRLLESPQPRRHSRPAPDGRRSFVRQTELATWFGCPQPDISRWEGYWQQGDWANLLSLHCPEVLTAELIRRIVTVCVAFPLWNQEQVAHYLQGQGVAVTERQVRQAMEQSGWWALRRELRRRYHWTAAQFTPREDFLCQELLRLNQLLVEHLEAGQTLPQEERVALTDLRAQLHESGREPPAPFCATPWLLRIRAVLCGPVPPVTDATVRCPHCGSADVGRKSRQPRRKKFWDAQGQLQEIAV
jgi:hypothetical protein